MTLQVMAALTDHTVKNKAEIISRICNGGSASNASSRRRVAAYLQKQSEPAAIDEDKELLALYLSHNSNHQAKRLPKSQGAVRAGYERRSYRANRTTAAMTRNQVRRTWNGGAPPHIRGVDTSVGSSRESDSAQFVVEPWYMMNKRQLLESPPTSTGGKIKSLKSGAEKSDIHLSMQTSPIFHKQLQGRKPKTSAFQPRLRSDGVLSDQ